MEGGSQEIELIANLEDVSDQIDPHFCRQYLTMIQIAAVNSEFIFPL